MKTITWSTAFLICLLLSTVSCFIDLDDDDGLFGGCIKEPGPEISVDLDLPSIDAIELALPGEVFITQGPIQQITVEAGERLINELELGVSNGLWRIDTDRCVRDADRLRVFITLPTITELGIIGSGDIVSENFLQTDDMLLYIQGSGDMDLGLDSDDLEIDITGSGDILLEGTADQVDLRISSSGDFRAFDLECFRAKINISGSGDAEVNVIDELDVRISGSGDVKYKGNPSIDVVISGSGRVIDAN